MIKIFCNNIDINGSWKWGGWIIISKILKTPYNFGYVPFVWCENLLSVYPVELTIANDDNFLNHFATDI